MKLWIENEYIIKKEGSYMSAKIQRRIVFFAFIGIFLFVTSCSKNNSISETPNELAIESAEITTYEPIVEPEITPEITSEPTPESMPEITPEIEPTLPPRESTIFRNTIWGDSPETVIAYETADYFEPSMIPQVTNNSIVYTDKIANLDTYIIYTFDSDLGLYIALYGINVEHTTDQLYITDYNKLKELLIEKYGTPYEDEVITLKNTASYTDEGTALKYGYVAYRARWKTDDTEIIIGMAADNYNIKTVIQYTSIKIIPDIDTSGF